MARLVLTSLISFAAALAAAGPAAANPVLGPNSGRPVPRYESLKYDEVNGRRGPSFDQQVLWTYHRRGLPVRVIAESGRWRRIQDPEGDLSWVNASMLEPGRTALVTGHAPAPLRRAPRPGAGPVALLAPGVVAQLKGCRGGWRELKVKGRQGWALSASLWGTEDCTGVPR